jgi:lipopolysaccharide export system protein LptA
MTRWACRAILMGAGFSLAASLAVAAQPAPQPGQQPSGAMQGFQVNRDQPVKIESLTLEVRDKQHQATFAGNVKLTQGDTTIQCKSLVVFYEDSAPAAPAPSAKGAPAPAATAQKAATPGFGGGNQQIKRVEARGDVLVTQKDQTAKGENGVFDIKTNNITLTGNVVVTQGTNVLTGERMVVDLTTGVTRVESGKSAPVSGLFSPGAPAPAAAPAPAPAPQQKNAKPAPSAKPAPGAPIRINQNMQPKKPAT